MPRQKQVEVTEEILAQIERVTGTTVSADDIVVFEAAALSTNPLSKPGSFYDGARPSRGMLEEMAAGLNDGTHSVPLHTMHLQGSEIPKGRVFKASIHDEIDGSATLRAMFYLPLAERELIEKINLSVLDEVSVGVKSKQALCSKCGFDYFGPDADFTNIWAATCENDHVIGQDGTHLKMVGLDMWMELSLVSRGASNKPKILSRAKQLVSKDDHDRMAADGTPLEALVLFTSTSLMEIPEMSKEQLDAMTAKLDGLTTKLEEMQAAAGAEDPRIAELTAQVEEQGTQVAELTAQVAERDEQIAELQAAAAEEPTIADLEAKLAELRAAQTELTLPEGGVSLSATSGAGEEKKTFSNAGAFKTRRNR